jgi:hypothetical protein
VRRTADAVAIACVLAAWPAAARANGAFPDSQTVITPADRPNQIILVTNFGLVISENGGQSWQWSCEVDNNAFGQLYQLGPAPRRRLFTSATKGLAYSDDGTCGWQIAGGAVATQAVTDFFPDPGDADRVLAIGIASAIYSVFASSDGGATFGPTVYRAISGDAITGVEIARSDPNIIYLAMNTAADTHPKLARSIDGGANFLETNLVSDLEPGLIRIIAVDAKDPAVVWLRWMAPENQAIAVTRDAGLTASKPLSIKGYFTSFVELPSGALLVAAVIDAGVTTVLYRSDDGGRHFAPVMGQPKIRALSYRAGILYAATENFGDGYALGVSSDEGRTWRGIMAYDQIEAILPCLRGNKQCQDSCEALAGLGPSSPGMIWEQKVCTANPSVTGAGGAGGAGGGGGAGGTMVSGGATGSFGQGGAGGTTGAAGSGRGGAPGGTGGNPPRSNGGCAVVADRPRAFVLLAIAFAIAVARRARRPHIR